MAREGAAPTRRRIARGRRLIRRWSREWRSASAPNEMRPVLPPASLVPTAHRRRGRKPVGRWVPAEAFRPRSVPVRVPPRIAPVRFPPDGSRNIAVPRLLRFRSIGGANSVDLPFAVPRPGGPWSRRTFRESGFGIGFRLCLALLPARPGGWSLRSVSGPPHPGHELQVAQDSESRQAESRESSLWITGITGIKGV